ncbi:unnamed protein product [Parnassius apollo]|uniref:(apollo) hypothetical protein n=1 Tax=Parnassius apollo TaxID=110799 RepID=A0A8S3Y2C4_PARAO|nr:unnamed protein product [Parnassius apollo]
MNFRAIFLFVFMLLAVAVAFPSDENRSRRDVAESVKSAASDAKKAISDAGAAVVDAFKPTEKSTKDKIVDSVKNIVEISSKLTMESQERIEDPSYLPSDLDRPTTPESEDSEFIQLDELLNPDRYLTKENNIKEMQSKAIALLFGKPKQLPNNNESQYVVQAITENIFKLTWKVIQPRA